jgi:hypothetical protein
MHGLLDILSRLDVVPVLIGGRALAALGIPTDTADVDLLLACDGRVVHQVMADLKAAGYRIDALSEDALRRGHSAELRCYWDEIQIDLIPAADPRLEAVCSRAGAGNWLGLDIRVARLADVLVEKLRNGRVRDLVNAQAAIRGLLSDSERRRALRDCRALGLTERCRGLVEALLGR